MLEQLLILAHEFDTRALVATLERSPNLDPSLRRYLPEAIAKLGRYQQIAINLASAARTFKYLLFDGIVVVPVLCNKC